MTPLLDVNVLVALAWPTHVHHHRAVAWFSAHMPAAWATAPITQAGFIRVSSNRNVLPDARSPGEAAAVLRAITDLEGHEGLAGRHRPSPRVCGDVRPAARLPAGDRCASAGAGGASRWPARDLRRRGRRSRGGPRAGDRPAALTGKCKHYPATCATSLPRPSRRRGAAGEAGARKALDVLAAGAARAHASMPPADQELRRRLRAHGRQLGDRRDPETGAQQIDRLAREVAYEHWHRMLFARFLAENDLLIEPESGVPVSLAECDELAREQEQDRWTVAGQFAERMLPQIFRNADPTLKVRLAPETRQELERLLESLPPAVFAARDSLGWTYQFWQAERKESVNKSGVKIGADELPAVTQLFTERYMVLFLVHNTIGAWRAGRILAANPELAVTAVSEEELRRAVRLESHGSYDFEYLRFVREPRDGDEADQPAGPWRPAAGTFADWPRTTAELRVLDPCCGSGHFLVESFDLLVRLRMEEERLTPDASVKAVLRDNLFGLEIDPRCTQIARVQPGADRLEVAQCGRVSAPAGTESRLFWIGPQRDPERLDRLVGGGGGRWRIAGKARPAWRRGHTDVGAVAQQPERAA